MKLTQLFEFFGNKLTIEKTMSPTLIAAIVALVAEAVKDAPQLVTDLLEIFSNPNPTPADWEKLRAKVLSESYADYVPASALAAPAPATVSPGVTTAAPQSRGPINDSGASATAAEPQKTQQPEPTPSAQAVAPTPSIPVGKRA